MYGLAAKERQNRCHTDSPRSHIVCTYGRLRHPCKVSKFAMRETYCNPESCSWSSGTSIGCCIHSLPFPISIEGPGGPVAYS
jgi:hypothetical protein